MSVSFLSSFLILTIPFYSIHIFNKWSFCEKAENEQLDSDRYACQCEWNLHWNEQNEWSCCKKRDRGHPLHSLWGMPILKWIEAVAKEFVIDKDKLAEKMKTRIFYREKMFEIDEKLMSWVISSFDLLKFQLLLNVWI